MEGEKREKRLAALLQAGVSAQHYFTLSIRGHPPLLPSQNISCFASDKDPFCPSHHRSPIISALILHEHLCRENTSKGKNKARTQRGLEDDEVPEEETSFPRSGSLAM